MINKEQVIEQIKQVFDPEIPVNVWDLGLIYKIEIEEANVAIDMSLTSRGCPSAQELPEMVRSRVESIPGIAKADVKVVWEPVWNPSMISPEGKKVLKLEDE